MYSDPRTQNKSSGRYFHEHTGLSSGRVCEKASLGRGSRGGPGGAPGGPPGGPPGGVEILLEKPD